MGPQALDQYIVIGIFVFIIFLSAILLAWEYVSGEKKDD